MGRYRSDSDDDRDRSRKHKKKSKRRRERSRSVSDSGDSHVSSSRGKKSKKRYRSSRSPSPSRSSRRSGSRSRSTSYDRYHSSSRRSKRSYSRSRSRSPPPRKGRRSRSGSRSRGQRRRSRSYSRERRSRSMSRSRSGRSSPDSRGDASSAIKGMSLKDGAPPMTAAQQAEERMRLALKAAAAADQKLRQLPGGDLDLPAASMAAQDSGSAEPRFTSMEESMKFSDSVAAIDSGKFKQSQFKSSSRSAGKESSIAANFDFGPTHDDAIFGSLAVTGFTIKPDPDTKPLDLNPESIIHPSLFVDPEDKMDRWIERLAQLRKKKLEGDAL